MFSAVKHFTLLECIVYYYIVYILNYNNPFRMSYLGLYVFAGFALDWSAVGYNPSVLRVFYNFPKVLK